MTEDPVIDRSEAQKAARVERLRAELAELGYAVIRKGEVIMTDDQIKYMVDRFLSWKLPEDFNPDNGISFSPVAGEGGHHPFKREPSGTNLLDAMQANAMVRYMVDGMP